MARTASYPNNARSQWVRDWLVQPVMVGGMLQFAYAMYPNLGSKNRGDLPFLYNSHKAMVRENHQRIKTLAGKMLHVSGAEVLPEDVEDFLVNDAAAYRWLTMSDTEWEDNRGRTLVPWMFPTYWGVMEGLDPQWQRETFILPQRQQVEELLEKYALGAEARRLFGDHRGTTVDLQVGASADDADQVISNAVNITNSTFSNDSTGEHTGSRFISTIPAGATIDAAAFAININSSFVDEPQHQLRGQAASAPGIFTTTSDDIDGRTRTTATHDWDSANLGASDEFWEWASSSSGAGNGVNIADIIQENVDALGELTTLVMIFEQHTANSNRDLGCDLYDGDTSKAPKLHIEFTEASSSVAVLRRRIEGA